MIEIRESTSDKRLLLSDTFFQTEVNVDRTSSLSSSAVTTPVLTLILCLHTSRRLLCALCHRLCSVCHSCRDCCVSRFEQVAKLGSDEDQYVLERYIRVWKTHWKYSTGSILSQWGSVFSRRALRKKIDVNRCVYGDGHGCSGRRSVFRKSLFASSDQDTWRHMDRKTSFLVDVTDDDH